MVQYLTEEDILQINILVIEELSPSEDIGIIDKKALNMCVELPKQEVYDMELYPTIESKGAILFEKLLKKHCFINGNKRTAYVAMKMFLRMNGVHLKSPTKETIEFCIDVVTKKEITNNHIINFIKKYS